MRRAPLILIAFFGIGTLMPPPVRAAEPVRKFPRSTGYVNDFARVLDTATRDPLEAVLRAFEAKTGIEAAIVTLPSLKDEPIEDVAVALFKEWGIGKQGKDNGVLLLVAPAERTARIEVGYDLESVLPDALAGRILREVMIPEFRIGVYTYGVLEGAAAVLRVLDERLYLQFGVDQAFHQAGRYPASWPAEPSAARPHRAAPTSPLVVWLMRGAFLLLMLYLMIRYPVLFWFFLGALSSGGGGRGGFGGGSRGFGGFGGGLSGGGGATAKW